MNFKFPVRADWRALTGAALIGSGIGLALGGCYLAGGMARMAEDHARSARLAEAAADGFSELALTSAAARMDPGVLRIAQRHDPFTVSGGAERDRQSAILAARLERRGGVAPARLESGYLQRASFSPGPAARPFRLAGAMESSRDLECLTQAVYFEARGEGASGQAAVAQVVLNRVRHPAFPKTVCGVVFQGAAAHSGCQFSFACDGSMRRGREASAWRRAQTVAARALSGAVMAQVGSATHFHTVQVAPAWGPNLLRVAQVGLHVFYRFGRHAPTHYVANSPAAPSAAPDPQPVFASLAPSLPGLSPSDFRLSAAVLETAGEVASAARPASGEPANDPASSQDLKTAKPSEVQATLTPVTQGRTSNDPLTRPKPGAATAS